MRGSAPPVIIGLLAALALLGGCGGDSGDEGSTGAAATSETTTESAFAATPVDVHALPLGDDKYEESGPRQGYVYSCIANFSGSGAFAQGPGNRSAWAARSA